MKAIGSVLMFVGALALSWIVALSLVDVALCAGSLADAPILLTLASVAGMIGGAVMLRN